MFLSKSIKTEASQVTATLEDGTLHKFKANDLVGAIDQGTSSTRFLVFNPKGEIAAWAQMEHTQIFLQGEEKVGWHEHDPLEIWNNVVTCMEAVVDILKKKKYEFDIKAIGITNQRETTLAWNASSGKPYYNAIVWDDTRTQTIASQIADGDSDRLRDKTGLPLASYFAGTKVKWLLDNVPDLQLDLTEQPDVVRFGTIDTWVLYQLSGKPSQMENAANVGGMFLTDVSNASRWLFMDITKVQWDTDLISAVCSPHSVPMSSLPEIHSSSEVYAICSTDATGIDALNGVPVAAILGDQQAALFGQCAFEPGEAKNTYGTGMFLMMNTGTNAVPSSHGLLTTVAYKLDNKVYYALEGSVSHSGSTIQWLRDQLKIINSAAESETIATEQNDGMYFVPAFAGLFAPHWRSDARACIVGMTASHHRGHICRAALEAAAYQTREVFDVIYADSKVVLKSLKVDGGGTNNKLLMQFQADMINVPVVKPKVMETTSMGVAFAAGLAVGVWKNLQEIRDMWSVAETFEPKMDETKRQKNWAGWQRAISKSLDWVEDSEDDQFEDAQESVEEQQAEGEDNLSSIQINSKSLEVGGDSTQVLALMGLVAGLVGVGVGFLLGRHKKL